MRWVTAFQITTLERRGHGDREGNGEDGKEVWELHFEDWGMWCVVVDLGGGTGDLLYHEYWRLLCRRVAVYVYDRAMFNNRTCV